MYDVAIGCIFAELMTLRPLFPGKTEGSQIIEQVAILGLPSDDDMFGMSSQMTSQTIELINRIDDIPKKDFNKILPKDYSKREIEMASDLLEWMLKWNPKKRCTCEEALKHDFFKRIVVAKFFGIRGQAGHASPFEPPLDYVKPIRKGKCKPLMPLLDGHRDYLNKVFEAEEPPKKVEIEKTQDRKERLKREKFVQHLLMQREEIKKYNPKSDPNVKGNEERTIFVGRLSHKTDEQKLKKEFEIFGPIRRLRVVVDQKTGRSRGYAFVEYESSQGANIAYDKGDGRRVDGRRVLVDFERGRAKKTWLPRRLGGGKGDSRRDPEEEKLIKELQKTHPLLRERSRSRSRDKLNGNGAVVEESKTTDHNTNHHNSHHHNSSSNRQHTASEKRERSRSKDKIGDKHRGRDTTPKKHQDSAKIEGAEESKERVKDHRDDRDRRDKRDKDHKKRDKKDKDKKDKKSKKDKKDKKDKKSDKKHQHKKSNDEAEPGEISE